MTEPPRCPKCNSHMMISRTYRKWAPGVYTVSWFCPNDNGGAHTVQRLKDEDWSGLRELSPEELEVFR